MLPHGYITPEEAAQRLRITSSAVRQLLNEYHYPQIGKDPRDRGLRGVALGEGRRRNWMVEEASLHHYKRHPAGRPRKDNSS